MSLQEFYDELVKHDWFHMMADDARTEAQGAHNLARLVKIAETSEAHSSLFREFRSYVYSRTPRPPRPEAG